MRHFQASTRKWGIPYILAEAVRGEDLKYYIKLWDLGSSTLRGSLLLQNSVKFTISACGSFIAYNGSEYRIQVIDLFTNALKTCSIKESVFNCPGWAHGGRALTIFDLYCLDEAHLAHLRAKH